MESPILVNTFFDLPSVSPAGVMITGCGAGGWRYGGGQPGCGVSKLSAQMVVSSLYFFHRMVNVSIGSIGFGEKVFEPLSSTLSWHTLRHHLMHGSSFVGVWANPASLINARIFLCSSHGIGGVASSHSTNPTGIMSNIRVSTLNFWSPCTSVYFNLRLLVSH